MDHGTVAAEYQELQVMTQIGDRGFRGSGFAVFCYAVASVCAVADVHYVSGTGSHVFPYTSRVGAATNIQAAVDAAESGDQVVVTEGGYSLSATVLLTNGIALVSDRGPANTMVSGQDQVRCFVLNHPDAILSGFHIMHGYAVGWFDEATGAGVRGLAGTLRDCVISRCSAEAGGGAHISANAVVSNCSFFGNESIDGGGGLLLDGEAHRCVVISNYARISGGGVALSQEGAVLRASVVRHNEGGSGGGVSLWEGAAMEGCLVTDNTADVAGGGVSIVYRGFVHNSTVARNSAPKGGGVAVSHRATVLNTVVSDNNAPDSPNWLVNVSNQLSTAYCCTPLALLGIGNITNDPQLTPLYQLRSTSPCIDAGSSSNAPVADIDGETRWDHPDHSNAVSIVDIGTDEFVDTDLDHMADYWEVDRLGSVTNSDGSRDGDVDDLTDLGEYEHGTDPKDSDTDDDRMSDGNESAADTDPLDPDSWLGITGIAREEGDVRITWKGGQDVAQVLEWRPDLHSVSDTWTAVRTVAPPTPITNSVAQSVSTNRVGFYRIRVVE